jgi:lysozyme family protein
MATFQEAIGKTLLFEGGYANNPSDSGGETYRGISRKNWPKWVGWALIDSVGTLSRLSGSLDSNIPLQGLVIAFYLKNFWRYDGLQDQEVADKVFDLSVNVGKVHALKILQQAVGTNQDGIYGPNTERLTNLHPQGSLASIIRASAEQYHKAVVQTHPEDAKFLNGWLRRDEA